MSKTNISQSMANGHPAVNSAPAEETNPPQTNESVPKLTGIDWAAMRVSQNFDDYQLAQRVAVSVAVEKPDKQSWIFIHPDRRWRQPADLYTDKVNRRTYTVANNIVPDVRRDVVRKILVPYADMQGNFGLWPIRLPDESGRIDPFNESAKALVALHAGKWIRVLLEPKNGVYYPLETPEQDLAPPKWPEGGLDYLLELAFVGRVIDSLDHPVAVSWRRAGSQL